METWAVSDLHGHLDAVRSALAAAGLVDEGGAWTGNDARLWFLGDYVDRGPDGLAVVELVMALQEQASAAGGFVGALLGNHEMLLLGMYRFADTPVPGSGGQSFAGSWLRNGGVAEDQERLEDRHLAWLTALPAVALEDQDLLLHSDTTAYLRWGRTVDAINATVAAELGDPDLRVWWAAWARLTSRYTFRRDARNARLMLEVLGGRRIVHGHSIVSTLHDRPTRPDDEPLLYADGTALAIDGGIYDGGPCLLVRLR